MKYKVAAIALLILLIFPAIQTYAEALDNRNDEGGPHLSAIISNEEEGYLIGIFLSDFDGNGKYSRTRNLEHVAVFIAWEEDGNIYMLAGSNFGYTIEDGNIILTGELEERLPRGSYLLRVRERRDIYFINSFMRFRDIFANVFVRLRAVCDGEGNAKYLNLFLRIGGEVLKVIDEGTFQPTGEMRSFNIRIRVRTHEFTNNYNGLWWSIVPWPWLWLY